MYPKMSTNLFDNDSDSDQDKGTKFQLNTNKDYAKLYNKFRSKELLKKRKYITSFTNKWN